MTETESIFTDLVYARTEGRELLLDLYLPADAPRPMPLIVWIYGGAWRMGDKSWRQIPTPLLKDWLRAGIYRLPAQFRSAFPGANPRR